MKVKLLLFIGLLLLGKASFAAFSKTSESKITVYVFLHEDCRISQYYTLPLKALHEAYAGETIQFIGIFPNHSSQAESMAKFKEKHKIPFELKTDHTKQLTRQLEATVTPEVVVFDETERQVLYRGRIDNTYARVGKKRQITSTTDLKDALEAIVQGAPILVPQTEAVGCFINLNE